MQDIIEVIKNLQTLRENDTAFRVLQDFERVLDELDIYVFKNWQEGELVSGPHVNRYSVKCTFMWPREEMPAPDGAMRLNEHGCKIVYGKENILMPRKIRDPGDFRPGTKKGKIDAHPIWTVTIEMPKKLMQDVYVGKENKENKRMSDLMKYTKLENTASSQPQEPTSEQPQS